MKIEIDDEQFDQLFCDTLVTQYSDILASMQQMVPLSTQQRKEYEQYTRLTAALAVVIAWNADKDTCDDLGIEWVI